MITLYRADERHHGRPREPDVWVSFDRPGTGEPLPEGLGALEILSEHLLLPGARIRCPARPDVEILTYVREGALAFDDTMGQTGVIPAGEFQRFSAGRSISRTITNPSRTDTAHVFQVWLYCPEAREPSQQQKRFSTAERRGGRLRFIASPDGRRGSLRLHQDAFMYSALLAGGHHIVHPLAPRRSAWLHVVEGEATLGDLVLATGDGVGLTTERSVSLTAREATEILLLDLGDHHPRIAAHGASGDRSTPLAGVDAGGRAPL